ncbi:MAG: molybdopterin-dependent oxidoreductase [Dehalococcoidia bacterium]|nr:molybdopterin-dependent oxidoreductase [Dehalococcoidia bacterium]
MDSAETKPPGSVTMVVPTGACYDCGGRCVLKVHVKDGVATRVETDDGEEPQLRACARGRAYRRQVYAPDRLLYPLKRTGERGKGEFKRISWDEALDTVAGELKRVKETWGLRSILLHVYSGQSTGTLHSAYLTVCQLLRQFGGYTATWGGASAEGSVFASRATFGTLSTGHTRDDLENSRLIILWGCNPATSIFGTNTSFYLAKAKEAGARIVVVDPRYTDTAAVFADQWVPVRPATDTAMMAAMAYTMVSEQLHDQRFLDRYTTGFEEFRRYVMGEEDGVPKTPEWAEAKTGVPASVISTLAREYATMKPAALIPGMAPGRTAYGEQYHRTAATLAAMTGNIGIHGGNPAGFERGPVGSMVPPVAFDRTDATFEERLKALNIPQRLRTNVHVTRIWDAILKGQAGGYPSDIKMAYIAWANPLNQIPNVNKGTEALKKLEFIVVHDQFMTATARFADVLLPATTLWERNDFARPWLSGPYFLYLNKVIEPIREARSDIDIFRDLAHRLGLPPPFAGLSEEQGIRMMVEGMGDVVGEIPDFETFKRNGVHKMKLPGPQLCFKAEIEDPVKHPFPTLSGKIEIYSKVLAALKNAEVPPVPEYIEPWEGPGDPLAQKYPLQLITVHVKPRAHSCFANNPWLKEIEPQTLWISKQDARSRGIASGDSVRVFNDRGETIVPATVTERIMPGVVALGEGAWYRPDNKGRDRGGSVNVLTRDTYSPGGAFPSNSALVQVERAADE